LKYAYEIIFIDNELSNWFFFLIAIFCIIVPQVVGIAYGHYFGATKNIDNYQVIFAPYPSTPITDDNSTSLNFSILENNTNVYNVYASLVVSDKQSGDIVGQVPYKLYEFSDIAIPYSFNETGNYLVTLQARITGDAKYQANPLQTSFDLSVGNQLIPFDELMLYYVTPTAVAIAGIAVYLHFKEKL
jgi:hypothetical protein